MFMWLNVLLGFLCVPIALIFGCPKRIKLVSSFVSEEVVKTFPVSSRTPLIWIEPWGWYRRIMEKKKFKAQAALNLVIVRLEEPETLFHECIHVIQVSVLSPVPVVLAYALDLLIYAPFHRWFRKGAMFRISTVEKIAYTVTGQDDQLRREEND